MPVDNRHSGDGQRGGGRPTRFGLRMMVALVCLSTAGISKASAALASGDNPRANLQSPSSPEQATAEQTSAKQTPEEPAEKGPAKSKSKTTDEPRKLVAKPPEDPSKTGENQPEKPATDDRERLKALVPVQEETEQSIDRLERVVTSMREAQSRMESKDAGLQTQEIQEKVVKDLEELIKQLEQQMQNPPPPSSKNSRSSQNKRPSTSQAQQDPQNSRQQESQPQQAASKNEGKADESTERSKAGKARREELERQRMVKDVWGHLPPALREELLNMYSEKYLPKYEDLVRRYYESLAEQSRKRSPGASRRD